MQQGHSPERFTCTRGTVVTTPRPTGRKAGPNPNVVLSVIVSSMHGRCEMRTGSHHGDSAAETHEKSTFFCYNSRQRRCTCTDFIPHMHAHMRGAPAKFDSCSTGGRRAARPRRYEVRLTKNWPRKVPIVCTLLRIPAKKAHFAFRSPGQEGGCRGGVVAAGPNLLYSFSMYL